jgi:hypothetical protein
VEALPDRVSTAPDCMSAGSAVTHVLVMVPVLSKDPVCSNTTAGVGIVLSTSGDTSIVLVLVGGNISNV